MMRNTIVVGMAALGLAGCTTIPKAPPASPVALNEVYQAVLCELGDVYAEEPENARYFNRMTAGPDLTLTNISDLAASGTLTFKTPTPVGGVTTTLTPGGNNSRKTTVVGKITLNPIKLSDVRTKVAGHCPPPGSPLANSSLGVADWLTGMVSTLAMTDTDPKKLNYDVTFNVSRSASGGLVFEMGPMKLDLKSDRAIASQEYHLIVDYAVGADAANQIRQIQADRALKELEQPQVLVQVLPQ